MKYLLIIGILFIAANSVFAQWSKDDLSSYRERADKITTDYIADQIKNGQLDPEYDSIKIAFTADTMKIKTIERLVDEDGGYTTLDMNMKRQFMLKEYDILLNKYYKYLIGMLSPENKIKFRNAQRAWLKYRDSEGVVSRDIICAQDGSMWGIVAGDRNLEILKRRVYDIYDLIKILNM